MEKAVFSGGCFWCVEAIFRRIAGVKVIRSGYAGGRTPNPSYEEVSGGDTGHAESVEVSFNPKEIRYEDLLYIFFRTHDPTTMNQQGADVGEQYRSMIFYLNEGQKKLALKARDEAQKEYKDRVVTEIVPLGNFFEAEEGHQEYYEKHKGNSYCTLVIDPKIKKLEERFGKYVKKQSEA